MNFRISSTFTDSLSKLSNAEQKAVKTTVFDLQLNPAHPAINFHKVTNAKDKHFFSVRVNKDIRIIVHKTKESLLLCYVDHHDKAYTWAERRKLETHPQTGAAQIIEIREKVKEIEIPKYVEQEEEKYPAVPVFENYSMQDLASIGVPSEWVNDVITADEDRLMQIVEYLPEEAVEGVLKLATGEKLETVLPREKYTDPFDHPDAQRRFRVMNNTDELERALEYPWEKWSIFLHPAQRNLVENNYTGPARVSGSAGTGKTVVALHRAVSLAHKYPDARILLTTFSENLANMLRTKLNRLISNNPRLKDRIEVYPINTIGSRLYEIHCGKPQIISRSEISKILQHASNTVADHKFTFPFLLTEWEEIIDAYQIQTWEDYKHVQRLGRKTRLPEKQRKILWAIFEKVWENIQQQGYITFATLFTHLANEFKNQKFTPFDCAVIDESQDITVPQLRFFAALGNNRENSLFFTGDLGQRIFQQPFSWKSLGVDIRGRSSILKINYRTSHQIRLKADKLLGTELSDVDGNIEDRSGTVSVFNGPSPEIKISGTQEQEINAIASWITGCIEKDILPHEIGLFVRSENEIERARKAIQKTDYKYKLLDSKTQPQQGAVCLSTMHLAKGLEFKSVAVMACDDEVIPSQQRIETVGDETDLEEIYNTERHLLYVACTRARDHLLVTGVDPASEFLDDMEME